MLKNNNRYRNYVYEVNVGGGSTTGSIHLSENATDKEIILSIMDQLYDVSYNLACDSCNTEIKEYELDVFETGLAENAKGERILYHICPHCKNRLSGFLILNR